MGKAHAEGVQAVLALPHDPGAVRASAQRQPAQGFQQQRPQPQQPQGGVIRVVGNMDAPPPLVLAATVRSTGSGGGAFVFGAKPQPSSTSQTPALHASHVAQPGKAFVFGSTSVRTGDAAPRPVDVSLTGVEATSGDGQPPGPPAAPVQAAWSVDDGKAKRPPAWGLAQQMGRWRASRALEGKKASDDGGGVPLYLY